MNAEVKQAVVIPIPTTYAIELSESEARGVLNFLNICYIPNTTLSVYAFREMLRELAGAPIGTKAKRSESK
jgi:hypothetical protein